MSAEIWCTEALPGARFGAHLALAEGADGHAFVAAAEAAPAVLRAALDDADGLLLVRGLDAISAAPALLLRLSHLFGEEVEDYTTTLTPRNAVHPQFKEIFVVSNIPPYGREPPARPEPALTGEGLLPTRFPQRRGWHSDQSYRRPPPDVSLFYAVQPAPQGQAQTLYASGVAAYASLPEALRRRADTLVGLHAAPGSGRSEALALAGTPPPPLEAHRLPQRQPVVRRHPVTGRRALYLCEAGQMDWFDGPFVGMQPGPHGDGARLLYELMSHYTRPEHVYVHEWQRGDLVIYDNRSLIHAATWFDSARHQRLMWRTTVHGNPGPEYAGEAPSWLPSA